MAGKPLHLHPEKRWSVAGANFLHRCTRCLINFLNILAVDLLPIARLKNAEHQWIGLPCRHTDAVGVVFNDEKYGQFLFFRERNRFEEIALASRGVTDCRDDKIVSTINLNAPGNSACGEKLRTGRRRHTPDMQIRVTVMRRHLPAAASGIAFREIFKTKFARRHTASENETAVPIVRHDVIVRLHEE